MKRMILFFATVFFTVSSYGQATTQDEYNYIKLGIKETIEKGLDVKSGYRLRDLSTGKAYANALLDAKLLVRNKDNSPAGTYIKITVTGTFSGDGTFYFCVPNPDYTNGKSYGWDLFYADLDKAGNTAKAAMLKWIAYQYSRGTKYIYAD